MVVTDRSRKLRTLLCAALLLSAAVLPARGRGEELPPPPSEPPVVGSYTVPLLFLFSHSGEQVDAAQLDTLQRSAAAALAARRPSVRLLLDNADRQQARSRAIERDAVGWVELSVSEDQSGTRISAAGYAVTAATAVFELSYREPPGLSGPRLRRAWEPAAAEFDRVYEQLVTLALADVRYTPVTLYAVAGTHVHGFGDTAAQVPDSGVLELQLPAPMVYTIEARAPLHYPLQQLVLVGEGEVELKLDQRARSAYSWDFGLANASYPSIEASRRIAGDYLFVRGGLTTYLIGLAPLADDGERSRDEEDKLVFSEDMTLFNLQLGSYLHPPYGRMRAYFGAGALWRLIHTRGYWGGDPVAAWGLLTTLGFENRPSERRRFFLEWQPALYLTDYPEILMQQLPGGVHIRGDRHRSDGDAFLTDETARSWVLSMGSFRLGVRWQP